MSSVRPFLSNHHHTPTVYFWRVNMFTDVYGYMCMYMYVHEGQRTTLVLFRNAIHLVFETGSLWSRAHQAGWASWPASRGDPATSLSLPRVRDAHTHTAVSCGSNSGLMALKANTSLTRPFPHTSKTCSLGRTADHLTCVFTLRARTKPEVGPVGFSPLHFN